MKDFLKRNVGYLVVALISVAYMATSLIVIDRTGKTIQQILVDGAVSFVLGIFISRVFELQGLINGDNDERTLATARLHSETVIRISPFIENLDAWCEAKNKENLRIQRTKILAREGMAYAEYFDEAGCGKGIEPNREKLRDRETRNAEKHRIRCYYKALRLHLAELSASLLTSEAVNVDNPYELGRTKTQYERSSSLKDVVSKLMISVIIGYYGVSLLQDMDYAELIWKGFQILMFCGFGVAKMMRAKMFVVDEYRCRVVKKIDNLTMFENYIKENHHG